MIKSLSTHFEVLRVILQYTRVAAAARGGQAWGWQAGGRAPYVATACLTHARRSALLLMDVRQPPKPPARLRRVLLSEEVDGVLEECRKLDALVLDLAS